VYEQGICARKGRINAAKFQRHTCMDFQKDHIKEKLPQLNLALINGYSNALYTSL